MFRRPLLPCALLSVALGVALSVAPAPVRAQDRSTQERLDRLERDLHLLPRQVYPGAPPPPSVLRRARRAPGHPQIRMERPAAAKRAPPGRGRGGINPT